MAPTASTPQTGTDVSASDARRARLLIDGRWTDGVSTFPVYDKFSGGQIGVADRASREQVNAAVSAAHRSFTEHKLDASERYRILRRAAELIEQTSELLARTITAEAGFPAIDANNEVARAAQTFLISAEEGKRLVGEVVPIEGAAGNAHRLAFTLRVPRGVVCGITSFNAPLNFAAHKTAPALASGNTVVLKAPQATPFSAALLFEILLEAGLPPGHVNLVQGPGAEIGEWLVANPAIRFFTFTGSTEVGRHLHRAVGLVPWRSSWAAFRPRLSVTTRIWSGPPAMRKLGVPPGRAGLHVDPAIAGGRGGLRSIPEAVCRSRRGPGGRRPAPARDRDRADD